MQVSFGQKIPIALAQIQNKQTGEFEQATIYEVDCKDSLDIVEARNDSKHWNFPCEIVHNMNCKYKNNDDSNSFYILQNRNFETIGRVQIAQKDDEIYSVEWLDTKENNGYRFVGQTILAVVGKEVLSKNGTSLAVLTAVPDAYSFYEDVCQFQTLGKNRYYMEKEEIDDFIKRTEKRTQGSIINLKV